MTIPVPILAISVSAVLVLLCGQTDRQTDRQNHTVAHTEADQRYTHYSRDYTVSVSNKNLAIANRSRVSCINTNNNTMTLKSGLEVTQGH